MRGKKTQGAAGRSDSTMPVRKEAKIRIEASSGLSKDEVEKMRRDADSHADDDKKKRELADARNEADAHAWQVEHLMKEHADKLSDGDKAPVQSAIDKLREARLHVGNMDERVHAEVQPGEGLGIGLCVDERARYADAMGRDRNLGRLGAENEQKYEENVLHLMQLNV